MLALQSLYIIATLFLLQFNNPPPVSAASLLTSYLPASMQALAYYIDHLQYEPLSTTTVEPPFSISDEELAAEIGSTTPLTPTTFKPSITTGWWKPPDWWGATTTTTSTTTSRPTPPHRPGLYAPYPIRPGIATRKLEGYASFDEIGDDSNFDFDGPPLSLIRDIQTEINHDEFTNDVESLDNFLRIYDDNYGRAAFDPDAAMDRWSSTSTAGKKRVPPTKPYVEFLLVYDLLKRDAKAANLSKYEGYSDELLKDLYELSHASAERQLYTLFKRMLDRRDIQRSDVVSRIQGIIKDLVNPSSATVKALRYIPALVFLP